MTHIVENFDSKLDLVFERDVDIAPELIWAAWTKPEHLVHWFTPVPWKTLEAECDVRPGGLFRSVMAGPNGERHENIGTYLEVVAHRRLCWTDALGPGYRPTSNAFVTAVVSMEPLPGGGTRYIACARHKDEATVQAHIAMGFKDGWGKALDQLVAYMKTQSGSLS
ncbi:SRPBCC family protein [Duganella aceris]|uniref:SRPBCC family protein n=1 Tax=Duganella aceris TaxID=2703883 RepID=A0ABX0FKC9_9BURK|nr:SRPBCC family protein [Duganella aceris]NGZ84919.1 SRPBCC family protein [Duganella aceris]